MFYDLREEFRPFLDELDVGGTGVGDLPRVCIHDTLTHVARFDGSFFALKAAVEPILAAQRPEPLRPLAGQDSRKAEPAELCFEGPVMALPHLGLTHPKKRPTHQKTLAQPNQPWQLHRASTPLLIQTCCHRWKAPHA